MKADRIRNSKPGFDSLVLRSFRRIIKLRSQSAGYVVDNIRQIVPIRELPIGHHASVHSKESALGLPMAIFATLAVPTVKYECLTLR